MTIVSNLKTTTSCESTESSMLKSNDGQKKGYTREEVAQKFDTLPISDKLDRLPAEIAYQNFWLVYWKNVLKRRLAQREKIKLQTYVQSTLGEDGRKLTNEERKMMAELKAMDETELSVFEAEWSRDLAQVTFDYLQDLFISARKLSGQPEYDRSL